MLVPRWASGGIGGGRRGMTRTPTDWGRLGDAGSTGIGHGRDGRRRTGRWKTNSGAPLPGAPNVGFQVPADPRGSNTRVRAEISPPTYLYPTASLRSKLWKEQHKRHRVYTGSGHQCGVIPYSSLWRGGLPLGLMMMNNTRKNSLARVCSWLGR